MVSHAGEGRTSETVECGVSDFYLNFRGTARTPRTGSVRLTRSQDRASIVCGKADEQSCSLQLWLASTRHVNRGTRNLGSFIRQGLQDGLSDFFGAAGAS